VHRAIAIRRVEFHLDSHKIGDLRARCAAHIAVQVQIEGAPVPVGIRLMRHGVDAGCPFTLTSTGSGRCQPGFKARARVALMST
jgi:hypothetical protein